MQEALPRSVYICRRQEATTALVATTAICIPEEMAERVAEHRTLARYCKFDFYKIQIRVRPSNNCLY